MTVSLGKRILHSKEATQKETPDPELCVLDCLLSLWPPILTNVASESAHEANEQVPFPPYSGKIHVPLVVLSNAQKAFTVETRGEFLS